MAAPIAALSRVLARPAVERAVRPVGDLLFGTLPVRREIPGPLVPRERRLVSVVMPSHGYAAYVVGAIRSAASQEGVDVEVVVVDDHGPDDSYALAQAEAARHPQGVVRVVRNERNLGHMASFARGCELARSEFLVRLDADDELTPGALARAVAVFEQAPSVGLVYGRPEIFSDPGAEPAGPFGRESARVYSGQEWLRRSLEQARNLITTPEAVMRTSLLQQVGPWRQDLPHSQDLEFWLRAASASDVAHVEGVYQARKRNHPHNMTNTIGMVGMSAYTSHADALAVLEEGIAPRVPDAARLRAASERVLANEAADHLVHGYTRGTLEEGLAEPLETFARQMGASPARLRLLDRAKRLGPAGRRDPLLVAVALGQAVAREARWPHWRVTGL